MGKVTFLAIAGLAGLLGWNAVADDTPAPAAKRFDMLVREDLFAGFSGDKEALARGLKTCEDTLKENPKHAEALVWRGAARMFQAGELFQAKKQADGLKLWSAGLKDMDEAVTLEPNNVGVRIPRAAVLLPATRNSTQNVARPLLESAKKDFETIYEQQKGYLDKLGTHPRGELRMGLAEVYRRLGEADKSTEQLKAVVAELPKTKYAARAQEWLDAKPDATLYHNCIGCHTN